MNTLHVQLQDLKIFFDNQSLPEEVELFPGTRIIDLPKFITSHLTIAAQPDPRGANDVFLTRLLQLKTILERK